MLDRVEVHGDVTDITEQPDVLTVGRDVDGLVGIGAVEHQRIGAGAAVDGVAAVAGVPDELVIAVAKMAMSLPSPPVTTSLPAPPVKISRLDRR